MEIDPYLSQKITKAFHKQITDEVIINMQRIRDRQQELKMQTSQNFNLLAEDIQQLHESNLHITRFQENFKSYADKLQKQQKNADQIESSAQENLKSYRKDQDNIHKTLIGLEDEVHNMVARVESLAEVQGTIDAEVVKSEDTFKKLSADLFLKQDLI